MITAPSLVRLPLSIIGSVPVFVRVVSEPTEMAPVISSSPVTVVEFVRVTPDALSMVR